jgi:hypothetical protein
MESVAPDRQNRPTDCSNCVFLRPRPGCPTSFYRYPLPTTSYHFSPHIKRLPKLVKQNRSALQIFLEKLFQEGSPNSTATCCALFACNSPHLASPFRLLLVHCSGMVMRGVSVHLTFLFACLSIPCYARRVGPTLRSLYPWNGPHRSTKKLTSTAKSVPTPTLKFRL